MENVKLDTLGQRLRAKRGTLGIRAVASDIGISTATLSRIENGHIPDLETFRRVCLWLGADPSSVLGFQRDARQSAPAKIHFKKKKTQSQATLRALGEMIAAAQIALDAEG